jgi:crotonobetainyl-CoA:carnitine CoA-transferase CaiB-like acyl-CoA transferase
VSCATHAAIAALAALARRNRTGQGAFIDVAGSDAVMYGGWMGTTYVLNDQRIADKTTLPAGRDGESASAKYQFYETKDGKFMLLCAIEPKFWRNFCRAAGREDLLGQHSEKAPVDFGRGEVQLRRELQKIFHTRDQAKWVELAIAHDVAMGPAYGVGDLPRDRHLKARGMLVEEVHPAAGPFTHVAFPARVDRKAYSNSRHAPALGEHTEEVLREAGYSDEDITGFRTRKVV